MAASGLDCYPHLNCAEAHCRLARTLWIIAQAGGPVFLLQGLADSNTITSAYVSCSLLITAFLLFSAAELAFGLMVAAACSRAKIAAIMAPILHLASLMPRYIFFRTGTCMLLSVAGC